MANFKPYLSELVRAVAVLSLFLFALTQAYPAAAAPDTSPVLGLVAASSALAAADLCGGEHSDLSHGACHACRFGPSALPPAPCTALPVAFSVGPVAYALFRAYVEPATAGGISLARAPPTA